MKRALVSIILILLSGLLPLAAQIQPGKAIQISISGVPPEEKGRFDTIYPVSESGNINMPFIGPVRASGLMAEQLASVLQQRYITEKIYTNPTFQVIDSDAKKIDQQVVYLGGDVRSPGPKPYNRNLTLYQALQAAGGETEFGAINRIALFRNGKRIIYNLEDPEHMNVILQPNDTIDVPRKNIFNR